MNVLDQARVAWAVTSYDWWLDLRGARRRRRRELRHELRTNLRDAAERVGAREAVQALGSTRRMAAEALPAARKAAAGCIGIAGAVGAYGGFFIPRGFAMAKDAYGSLTPALHVFVVAYVLMALTTYAVYQRRGAALAAETI